MAPPNSNQKTVLHVDINAYFATMLQQKYPALRGQPIGVVKDVGRSSVIASSKEAKTYGVKTGSDTNKAKSLCPHIVFVPAQFDFYLDSTRKLHRLFQEIVAQPEIFSLDEAFLDITHYRRLYPDPQTLSINIKRLIKTGLGEWVTCNIGISHNRFLAKLGSELSPKDSVTTVTAQNQDQFLATTDFASVCGIGLRLERRLHRLGITSLFALSFVSDRFLQNHFGPFWSVQLRRMALGKEPHLFSLIDHNLHMKSLSRSVTGYRLTQNLSAIKAVLYNLTDEVIHKARRLNLAGRQISLSLSGRDRHFYRHITLKHHVSHTREMFDYLYHHLCRQWRQPFPVIKFSVRLGLLKPIDQIPQSLLPKWQKQEKLQTALDDINHKYGLFTVRSGLLLNRQVIKPEVTGFLGDKQYWGLSPNML